jgi:hypothetical protein
MAETTFPLEQHDASPTPCHCERRGQDDCAATDDRDVDFGCSSAS